MQYEPKLTSEQEMLIANLPRYTAAISFVCALYIIVNVGRDPQKRRRVFHRLMFAIAVNVALSNMQQCWGTAAVPVGTEGVYGAKGNTTTCTVKGILNQIFVFSIPGYYFGLSIFSFMVIRSNFNGKKYAWIEKWIHVGAYVYPVVSSIYLTYRKAFNYAGVTCWIASVPFGCGDHSGTVCTRGPQNIMLHQVLFGGLPMILLLVLPSISMMFVYLYVRVKQQEILIKATSVAKQAGVYLVALYWTYFFSVIHSVLMMVHGERSFALAVFAPCWKNLQGLWIMLVYQYFGAEGPWAGESSQRNSNHNSKEHNPDLTTRTLQGVVVSSDQFSRNDDSCTLTECNDVTDERVIDESKSATANFSIFDGTNASSRWDSFVFEGDSQDEEADEIESYQWDAVIQT